MKWFRLWTDILDDVKMLQLTDYEFKIFTFLLAHASEVDSMSGECQSNVKSMSIRFRTQVNHLSKAFETFQKLGLITMNGDGHIKITNWSKRQFRSDNVYARVKKHREVTQNRNVSCNDIETVSETDSDTDTDRDINISCPHKEIVQTYNDILGTILTPAKYSLWMKSDRSKTLQSRWKQDKKHQSLEFWEGLFIYVRDKCPFLVGTNDRQWKADIGWIIKRENFIKILEGKYERRA